MWTQHYYEGLHTGKKKSSFVWSFQWKLTLMTIFSTCVSKLESRMLITITNSNSSPEVNSSEVSLKSQCEFRVCTQKHPKHLFSGGGAYVCLCTHVFIHVYRTNSFLLSRICILKTNCNHHYNDHSSYEFSLVCNRSMTVKEKRVPRIKSKRPMIIM